MSSFRKSGGLNYAKRGMIVRSHITNSDQSTMSGFIGLNNTKIIEQNHVDMNTHSLLNVGTIYYQDGTSQSTAQTTVVGAQGAQGAPGESATVTVGSTTQLQPNTDAYVTQTGTTDVTLYFGIPQGAQGASGESSTIAIGSTTQLPSTDPPTVTNIGTQSAAILNFGIPAGAQGAQGEAANVTVASTTTLESGQSAYVYQSGTTTNVSLAFGIPAGAQGAQGPQGASGSGEYWTANPTTTGIIYDDNVEIDGSLTIGANDHITFTNSTGQKLVYYNNTDDSGNFFDYYGVEIDAGVLRYNIPYVSDAATNMYTHIFSSCNSAYNGFQQLLSIMSSGGVWFGGYPGAILVQSNGSYANIYTSITSYSDFYSAPTTNMIYVGSPYNLNLTHEDAYYIIMPGYTLLVSTGSTSPACLNVNNMYGATPICVVPNAPYTGVSCLLGFNGVTIPAP